MENQHRKIKGYRELSQEEIDLVYHTCVEMTGWAAKNQTLEPMPPNEEVRNFITYKNIRNAKSRKSGTRGNRYREANREKQRREA